MRRITLMAVLAATVLSSCVNTVLPVTRGRIETRDQFLSTLGGRTVTNGEVTVQMGQRWLFRGTDKGQPFEGQWTFRDGLWCRTVTRPTPLAEECQILTVRGETLTVIRNEGQGPTQIFRILRRSYPA